MNHINPKTQLLNEPIGKIRDLHYEFGPRDSIITKQSLNKVDLCKIVIEILNYQFNIGYSFSVNPNVKNSENSPQSLFAILLHNEPIYYCIEYIDKLLVFYNNEVLKHKLNLLMED